MSVLYTCTLTETKNALLTEEKTEKNEKLNFMSLYY